MGEIQNKAQGTTLYSLEILLTLSKTLQVIALSALIFVIVALGLDGGFREEITLFSQKYFAFYSESDWVKEITLNNPNYSHTATILSVSAITTQAILGITLPIALALLFRIKICPPSMSYETLQKVVSTSFYSEIFISPFGWALQYRRSYNKVLKEGSSQKSENSPKNINFYLLSEIFAIMVSEPQGKKLVAIQVLLIAFFIFVGFQHGMLSFNEISFYIEFSLLILCFHLILFQVVIYVASIIHSYVKNIGNTGTK